MPKISAKKAANLFQDLLLSLPLCGGGYSFVMGCLSIRNLNNAFNRVSVM